MDSSDPLSWWHEVGHDTHPRQARAAHWRFGNPKEDPDSPGMEQVVIGGTGGFEISMNAVMHRRSMIVGAQRVPLVSTGWRFTAGPNNAPRGRTGVMGTKHICGNDRLQT